MSHYKKDNANCVCYKCKQAPRYKNQSYCYDCFYDKCSKYSTNKFKKKREKVAAETKIESLEGEIWSDVSFFDGYKVSNYGRVKSTVRRDRWGNIHNAEKLLKATIDQQGYRAVKVYSIDGEKLTKKVHKLVALCFLEPVDGCDVINHKDGNKLNNIPSNLEWCTASYNTIHAWENGLIHIDTKGEKHPMAKLNNDKVLEIRRLYESGEKKRHLAQKFSVTPINIDRIVNKKIWKHI